MSLYQCKIGTNDGRVLEKEYEAVSLPILRDSLEEQGFYVFDIRRKSLWQGFFQGIAGSSRPSGRDFLLFNQELLVLLRSGLPILQVLDTVTERMDSDSFREALRDIREEIRGGALLSESFSKYPHLFPHLYIASIKAGEKSGDLPVTLGRFILYQKRVESIRAKVKSAVFYPILLSLAVITVVLFLLFYVIPSFSQIYADANAVLPLATRVLIAFSRSLISGLPILLPMAVSSFFVMKAFLRSESGIRWRDRLFLQSPFLGRLVIDYAILGFCRTFGTTLSSGIPIVEAMSMSRGTLNNRLLEEKMVLAIQRIEEGASISLAISEGNFFPALALRMIAVGESIGALPEMLWDVADYYESEVERRLDRLTTMVEPLMMMTMGVVIGAIVIAMYIPIFQLASTVR